MCHKIKKWKHQSLQQADKQMQHLFTKRKKAITTQAYLHCCIITICSIYRYTVHSEVRSLFISVPLADSLSHKHTVHIQTARI